MLRPTIHRSLLATLLLTTAACTQPAAQIDLRGQNDYGKNGSTFAAASSFSNYSPSAGMPAVSINTQQAAPSQSIGVSDLTPPSQSHGSTGGSFPDGHSTAGKNSWNMPANSPFKTAVRDPQLVQAPAPQPQAKLEEKPVAPAEQKQAALPSDDVNPWTKTHRTLAAADALDESFHLQPQGKAMDSRNKQLVADVKPVEVRQKTASLDNIVDSADAPKKVAVAPKAKKVDTASNGFMWPVNSHKVISEFGPKGKGKVNDGINIASAAGEPVWASADGEVVYVGNELQGYGNMVLIKHGNNKTTTYAHLNRYTVDKYDRVKQGDIIGYVGSTGNVKDPQLHFSIRDGNSEVDPLKYLARDVASLR